MEPSSQESAASDQRRLDSASTAGSAGPPPSLEQRQYWARDLLYKKVSLFISSGGFLLVAVGLVANYRQLSINTEQLRLNATQSDRVAQSIRAGVEHDVVSRVNDMGRIFVEYPELIPYFYGGVPIEASSPNYNRASGVAAVVLDVFDWVATQSRRNPQFWDTPEAWGRWMVDMFSSSPILRDTFDRRKDWYGVGLIEVRARAQGRIVVTPVPKATP